MVNKLDRSALRGGTFADSLRQSRTACRDSRRHDGLGEAAMIRLHVPHDLAAGAELALDEGQSRYLAAVMRLSAGDELLVFNGRDGEWRAKVVSVGKRAVTLVAEAQARPQATGPDLDLVIALVKRARLETIVEKAAELGARRVRPVITERTNADHT